MKMHLFDKAGKSEVLKNTSGPMDSLFICYS